MQQRILEQSWCAYSTDYEGNSEFCKSQSLSNKFSRLYCAVTQVDWGLSLLNVVSPLLCAVRCALTCSTSTSISFDVNRCNSSQILIHRSASPAFGSMHFLSPHHKPSIIPLLSTSTLTGSMTFLRRQRKAVSSALLMVRWTCTSHARAPVLRHNPTTPLINHTPSTFQRYPEESRPLQRFL